MSIGPLFRGRQWVRIIVAAVVVGGLGGGVRADAPAAVATPNTPQATRASFLKIIDRPRVPAAVEEKEVPEPADSPLVRYDFSYASDATHRVPGILVRPREAAVTKRPAVIVLHGTGSKKESNLALVKALAAKGFVGVTIDGRYHGERMKDGDYNEAIARAFKEGGEHPLYFDTVWDVMRLIDLLQARPDVDGTRIGLIGFSKGGIETWLCSSMDERVACAVPCIGVQSFRWGLDNNAWPKRVGTVQKGFSAVAAEAGVTKPDAAFAQKFYDRLIPGIYEQFDGPAVLPMIAPRPLLVINGENDLLNPLPGLKLCTDAAAAAYEREKVPEKFKFIIQKDTAHAVTKESRDEAVEWFVKWLKP